MHVSYSACCVRQNKRTGACQSVAHSPPSPPERTTEGEHVFPLLRHRISEFPPPPPLRAAAAHPESLFAPWEVFVFGTFSLTGDETVLTSITNSWRAPSGTARLEKQRRNERKKYITGMRGERPRGMAILQRGKGGQRARTHKRNAQTKGCALSMPAPAAGGERLMNTNPNPWCARAATEIGDGRSMHVHKNN